MGEILSATCERCRGELHVDSDWNNDDVIKCWSCGYIQSAWKRVRHQRQAWCLEKTNIGAHLKCIKCGKYDTYFVWEAVDSYKCRYCLRSDGFENPPTGKAPKSDFFLCFCTLCGSSLFYTDISEDEPCIKCGGLMVYTAEPIEKGAAMYLLNIASEMFRNPKPVKETYQKGLPNTVSSCCKCRRFSLYPSSSYVCNCKFCKIPVSVQVYSDEVVEYMLEFPMFGFAAYCEVCGHGFAYYASSVKRNCQRCKIPLIYTGRPLYADEIHRIVNQWDELKKQ